MSLSLKFPDQLVAGLNHSCTVTSDEGPPTANLLLESTELSFRIVRLGPPKTAPESTTSVMKYKVTFFLPGDAGGKTLSVDLGAGSSKVHETKSVVPV